MEENLDIKARLEKIKLEEQRKIKDGMNIDKIVINPSLTEMKMRALMMIVEKLVARYIERYNFNLTILDEGNLTLFGFAKRFYLAEGDEAFQKTVADLAEFTISEL